MRKEVKHDLHLVERKIEKAQQKYKLGPILRCQWICTPKDL